MGFRKKVLDGYLNLINLRKANSVFNPYFKEDIVFFDKRLFVLKRREIYLLINLLEERIRLDFYLNKRDLISKNLFDGQIDARDFVLLR